jgi:Zn-dependent protease with chaperone function
MQAQPVQRFENEIPLLVLVILLSIALWIVIAVSIVGIFYAVFFAIFFFLAHVALVAHLRGSAIKLGSDQLPDLYGRIVRVAEKLGMQKLPDAYLMQAGGALNAFATKLFRSNFIVLYADLLEACGEDTQAADFVVAHELGHVMAGHLRFQWLIAPGRLFPFIGTAYSQAREFTADRYGAAGVDDRDASVRGLTLLAAGGSHAKKVNLDAMLQQRHDLKTVWMTIGRWMSTHPPLVNRIAEMDRARAGARVLSPASTLGAAAVIAFAFILPMVGGGYFFSRMMKKFQETADAAKRQTAAPEPESPRRPAVVIADVPAAAQQAQKDLHTLATVADDFRRKTGRYPETGDALYALWRLEHPLDREPRDPFDKNRYGYDSESDDDYDIYSTGNDRADYKGKLHVHSPEGVTTTRP